MDDSKNKTDKKNDKKKDKKKEEDLVDPLSFRASRTSS